MFARYVWIIAPLFAAGCGGINILPEPFTRERVDGKIPVKVELIRKQVRAELDGVPEGEAEVLRWQAIEKDYNECRLSSARATKSEAEEVFAVCMSRRDYVYMLPIDAEQFHNDIFFELRKEKEESERLAEERRIAAEKKREEERIAREKKREEERIAREKKAEEERIVAAAKAEHENNLKVYARDGELLKVRRLLSLGINPNAVGDEGVTALIFAAFNNGNAEVVKALLSAGADPNAAADDGVTALMIAAEEGNSEIAKVLLVGGANPNMANNNDWTALIAAARVKGNAEVVKMLLAVGADVNAVDNVGSTALRFAAEEGNSEIVKILLSAGANPNAAADDGSTALMYAAWKGHAEVAKMLLSAGANPNAVRDNGVVALMQAAQYGHSEIAKMLLSAGANPNAVDKSGHITALMTATALGHAEFIKILIAGGAEVNQRTLDGVTALDLAKVRGFSEIERILLSPERYRNYDIRPSTPIANSDAIKSPQTANPAESVFAKVWQSIVVVKSGERQGSGVIVRPNVVATNCHIFDGGEIAVYKHNNRRASTDTIYAASVMKRDDYRDFCLLRVRNLNGAAAQIRRYDNLGIGENVYAVGSPRGLDLSLSAGLISQLRQSADRRWIQTDAAISPGSSGGGLFDSSGNLIGITTEKITDENVEGIAFAIPADLAVGY